MKKYFLTLVSTLMISLSFGNTFINNDFSENIKCTITTTTTTITNSDGSSTTSTREVWACDTAEEFLVFSILMSS